MCMLRDGALCKMFTLCATNIVCNSCTLDLGYEGPEPAKKGVNVTTRHVLGRGLGRRKRTSDASSGWHDACGTDDELDDLDGAVRVGSYP